MTEEIQRIPYEHGVRLNDQVRLLGGSSTKIDCHHFEKGHGPSTTELALNHLKKLGCKYYMEIQDADGLHVFGATDALRVDDVPDQEPYTGPYALYPSFEEVKEDEHVAVKGHIGIHVVQTCHYEDLVVVRRLDDRRAPFSINFGQLLGCISSA